MKTTSKRITPCFDMFESVARNHREDAERQDRYNGATACHAVLWFFGTGRAFSGAHRLVSHMHRGTMKAFLRRVEKGMVAAAAKRGSSHAVMADLTNAVLAEALGVSADSVGVELACSHPYGVVYTLASARP